MEVSINFLTIYAVANVRCIAQRALMDVPTFHQLLLSEASGEWHGS